MFECLNSQLFTFFKSRRSIARKKVRYRAPRTGLMFACLNSNNCLHFLNRAVPLQEKKFQTHLLNFLGHFDEVAQVWPGCRLALFVAGLFLGSQTPGQAEKRI
jgi:hypothetical protein